MVSLFASRLMADPMLTTTEACIHVGCQFHLKGGEFLLDTSTPAQDGGMQLFFASMSGLPDRTSDVTPEGMEDPMWNLTQCNFPAEHGQ